MNGFDIALLILACVLIVIGVFKGLVRVLIGIAALVAAFALAAHYHRPLAELMGVVDVADEVLLVISYVLIFIAVMLAGGLLARLLRKLLKQAMLSWADRLAGATVGLLAAALVGALIVLPVVAYSPWSERMLGSSVLAPYVVLVAEAATAIAPDELTELYREGLENLRRLWNEEVPKVVHQEA